MTNKVKKMIFLTTYYAMIISVFSLVILSMMDIMFYDGFVDRYALYPAAVIINGLWILIFTSDYNDVVKHDT